VHFLVFIVYYVYQQTHTHTHTHTHIYIYIYIYNSYNTKLYSNISNKMQQDLETALHVSGGTSTHHQERIQLYIHHPVCHTVTESCISEFSEKGNIQRDVTGSRMKVVVYCGNTNKRIQCEASRRYALRKTNDA
jgi:hypothetical protein